MKNTSKYKKQKTNQEVVDKYLSEGKGDWRLAKDSLRISSKLSFQTAYEAILKISLALMISYGIRPRSLPGHHKAIIDFVDSKLGPQYRKLIKNFDEMRRKRNKAIYEVGLLFSHSEATQAIKLVERFIKIIEQKIEEARRQEKLL